MTQQPQRRFGPQNKIINWQWLNQERLMLTLVTFEGHWLTVWGHQADKGWNTLCKTAMFLYGEEPTPQGVANMFAESEIMKTALSVIGYKFDEAGLPIIPEVA